VTRRIIVAILRFTLRIYFRRIEVAGVENVPAGAPVIFVMNHPNALVDPVFLLCLAPRKIAFIAKAPLFRMPVIGLLVRALDSLPAYRRQDQEQDVARNAETFAAARKLLAAGVAIGICPEGISHSEPGLQPIKTGAARIALGATANGEVRNLKIVPAGLYYTAKTVFRSSALLYYGRPIDVKPIELEPDGSPPRTAVRELSAEIAAALRAVMLDAQHEEGLHLITRAERIFSSTDPDADEDGHLAAELRLRQQFVKGYDVLRLRAPTRLRVLQMRINRFEEGLRQAGIEADELEVPRSVPQSAARVLLRCLLFLVLLPPALIGIAIHFPVYRLGGYLAVRLSQSEQDIISTIKIISAMLLYPITWLVVSFALAWWPGWPAAVVALLVMPVTGYIAMRFLEEIDAFAGGLRAMAFFLTRRRFFVRLLAERRAIREEILALGEEALPTR